MSTTLPREVIKWIQSLDLTHAVKRPKRDLANGVLVGEILSRYVSEVPLHGLDNSSSTARKLDNWRQLEKHFGRAHVSLPKELVTATLECREGAAVELLRTMYTQLTGRQIQYVAPMQAEAVDVKDIGDIPKMKYQKDVVPHKALAAPEPMVPEAIASPAPPQQLRVKSPAVNRTPRVAARPTTVTKMQAIKPVDESRPDTPNTVEFTRVTVKAVDISVVTHRKANAHGGDVSTTSARKSGARSEGDVFLFLAQCVQESFRRTGMFSEVGHGDKAFQMLVAPDAEYSRNVIESAWSTIFSYIRRLVDILVTNDVEFVKLLAALDFLWEREFCVVRPQRDAWDIHCEKARLLLIAVGEEVASRDVLQASELATKHLLPKCMHPLLHAQAPVRHNVARIIGAYLTGSPNASKLTFLHTLQECLSKTTVPGSVNRRKVVATALNSGSDAQTESQQAVVPLRHLGSFITALAAISTVEVLAPGPDTLADMYRYYAAMGLTHTSPTVVAASLCLLERLVSTGHIDSISGYLEQIHELAKASARGGVHWEVTAQLVLLVRSMLDADPSDDLYDLAQILLTVQSSRFLRAFTLCQLAPHLNDEKPEMNAEFFTCMFLLPPADRAAVLRGDVTGLVHPNNYVSEMYTLPYILDWDVVAVVNTLVDMLQHSQGNPMKDILRVLDVILESTISSSEAVDSHGFWMSFMVRTQDEFSRALAIRGHPPGLVDAETKELCFVMAKRMYMAFSGVAMKPDDSVSVTSKKIVDWYRVILQNSSP